MKTTTVEGAKAPERHGEGFQFFIPEDFPGDTYLLHGQHIAIDTGVTVEVPKGYLLMSLGGVEMAVFDSTHKESIRLVVINNRNEMITLEPGDLLTTMVLVKIL